MRHGQLGTIDLADRLAILTLDACHVQTKSTSLKQVAFIYRDFSKACMFVQVEGDKIVVSFSSFGLIEFKMGNKTNSKYLVYVDKDLLID
jgi:hypothetical protein